MTVGKLDKKMVKLVPGEIMMEQKTDMTMFIITHWKIVHINENNPEDGRIQMVMVFQRKSLNEILTTYLPSILLLLITYATTHFKAQYFEAALSVNLTTMLVMTTIFTDVSQSLPITSYVKLIDIWLIFGQIFPFAQVIILTVKESMRKGDGSDAEATNDHGVEEVLKV